MSRGCKHCGAILRPKIWTNGKEESQRDFEERSFCSQQCNGAHKRNKNPPPSKPCKHCGKMLTRKQWGESGEAWTVFERRLYCDQVCMAAHFEGKMRVPTPQNSRNQSKKHRLPFCERCGAPGKNVHHKDENPLNNEVSNLMTLCMSCHGWLHSPNCDPTTGLRRNCTYCDRPSFKNRLCYTHQTRLKRFGHPLAKKRKIGSDWVLMLHDGKSWSPFH